MEKIIVSDRDNKHAKFGEIVEATIHSDGEAWVDLPYDEQAGAECFRVVSYITAGLFMDLLIARQNAAEEAYAKAVDSLS